MGTSNKVPGEDYIQSSDNTVKRPSQHRTKIACVCLFFERRTTLQPRLASHSLRYSCLRLLHARITVTTTMPGYICGHCNLPYNEGASIIRIEFTMPERKKYTFDGCNLSSKLLMCTCRGQRIVWELVLSYHVSVGGWNSDLVTSLIMK